MMPHSNQAIAVEMTMPLAPDTPACCAGGVGEEPATHSADRLPVTFALFAYNQEKYIREAVEGAFAQKYEPLEIILSDDCSTDRTFEIMEEMALNYHGPAILKLNKNKVNLGVVEHVNLIHKISTGTIIIHAAGDDISCPERVLTTVRAFFSGDSRPSVVMSYGQLIDSKGKEINRVGADNFPCGGASLALHRELADTFPSSISGIHAEDVLILNRANLLNGSICIREKLIKYRVLDNSLSLSGGYRKYSINDIQRNNLIGCKSSLCVNQQILMDLVSLGHGKDSKLFREAQIMVRRSRILVKMLSSRFLVSSFYLVAGVAYGDSIASLKLFLTRWFPNLLRIKIYIMGDNNIN